MEYWAPSVTVDDEFEKLVLRMNPPRYLCRPLSSTLAANFPKILCFFYRWVDAAVLFLILGSQGYGWQCLQQEDHADQGNSFWRSTEILLNCSARTNWDWDSDYLLSSFQVDSANKRGSLLELVQVLTDMNLIIRRAYISSDGEWFMDGESLNLNPPPLYNFFNAYILYWVMFINWFFGFFFVSFSRYRSKWE